MQAKNNINGSSSLAGISSILNKAVCIVSIVLSYKSSNKIGPETNNNTQEELPILDNFLEFEIEDGKGRWESYPTNNGKSNDH